MLAESQRVPVLASLIYKTVVCFYQKQMLEMRGREEDAAKSGGMQITDN
ncbi:hypothetical protein [Buttiauxella sp. B2]|nr:hypothetical protein [Buttiauxella sp. B2]